jgi:hypothetical protein
MLGMKFCIIRTVPMGNREPDLDEKQEKQQEELSDCNVYVPPFVVDIRYFEKYH